MKQLEHEEAKADEAKLVELREKASQGKKKRTRRPLSVFSKIVIGSLLGIATLWGVLAIILGQTNLLYTTIIILLVVGFIATGVRWAPALGSLLCSMFFAVFLFASSFPLYHLSHPKDAYGIGDNLKTFLSYVMFVVILVLFWCMIATIASGITAVVLNYLSAERKKPRWFNTVFTLFIGILLGGVLLGALSNPTTTDSTPSINGGAPVVHLGLSSFSQSSITISKGATLQLIVDGTFHHKISFGTWSLGQPAPESLPGEPVMKTWDIEASGASTTIGPFTTAGTYHLFCSIHTGMMLTIIVQ